MVDSRYPSFGRFILFHLWLLSKPDYLRLGDLPPARGVCAGEHVDASGSNESESKLGSVEFTRSIISDRSTDLFSLSHSLCQNWFPQHFLFSFSPELLHLSAGFLGGFESIWGWKKITGLLTAMKEENDDAWMLAMAMDAGCWHLG